MNQSIKPLVSIITVCYNERDRIEETLKSSISQSYAHIELIVVDGNSSDGTTELVKKHHEHITHLLVEPDDGVYHAMNRGLGFAKGEYIIFMNGGDKFYDDDVVANMFESNNNHPDILYGNIAYVYPNGSQTVSVLPDRISKLFLTFNTICHQAMACKRDLIVHHGGFNTKFLIAADYDFLMSSILRKAATTKYIPLTVAYFYKDGLSFKEESKSDLKSERLSIQKEYLNPIYYRFSLLHQWTISKRDSLFFRHIRRPANRLYQKVLKPKEVVKNKSKTTNSP
jgi:glycosyltransferase involved in cell wall biosynthesis